MRKHKKNNKRIKLDADLDRELNSYDVESSDDGLDADDKILLNNARGRKVREEEEEVLPVREASSDSDSSEHDFDEQDEYDDDDGELEDEQESGDNINEELTENFNESDLNAVESSSSSEDMESDIENNSDDGLPDSKAWGSNRKNYYNTDYVDKDFSGFDNEEAAIMEEQEAKSIQQRLLEQLEETDFTMGLLDKVEEKKKEAVTNVSKPQIEEKIKIDFSKLSKQELKEHEEREIPGFNTLKEECKRYAIFANNLLVPVFRHAVENNIFNLSRLDVVKRKYALILRYILYFTYLMRLKVMREPNIDRHPVMKYIVEISKQLKEIDSMKDDVNRNLMDINVISRNYDRMPDDKKLTLLRLVAKYLIIKQKQKAARRNKIVGNDKKKKLLRLINEKEKESKQLERKSERKIKFADELEEVEEVPLTLAKQVAEVEENAVSGDDMEIDNDENEVENEKRAITYQMLKNKGLTPKRKKEVKNPRVKNKNKYKKALVRRKGQVKLARNEIKKYDGEISGIKKNLSRSIKLK